MVELQVIKVDFLSWFYCPGVQKRKMNDLKWGNPVGFRISTIVGNNLKYQLH